MYQIIVGEKGNELGHIVATVSDYDRAVKIATRAVKAYKGDGWWKIREVEDHSHG